MAKILGNAMGIYADSVHFSGFQLENAWTLRGGGGGWCRRRVLCKTRTENLYWVLLHLIWQSVGNRQTATAM